MKLVAAETVKLSTETRLNPTLTGTLPAADWHVKRIAGLLCRIYLLELAYYLRLNPLRAQVVTDLRALDRFP